VGMKCENENMGPWVWIFHLFWMDWDPRFLSSFFLISEII
jgi:hypothetical protein